MSLNISQFVSSIEQGTQLGQEIDEPEWEVIQNVFPEHVPQRKQKLVKQLDELDLPEGEKSYYMYVGS